MALEELGGREDSCAYDGPRHRRCSGGGGDDGGDDADGGGDGKDVGDRQGWTGCSTPPPRPK